MAFNKKPATDVKSKLEYYNNLLKDSKGHFSESRVSYAAGYVKAVADSAAYSTPKSATTASSSCTVCGKPVSRPGHPLCYDCYKKKQKNG